MQHPLISIIVPIYNAAKTLRRCIDSILAQTYRNFELILINDGSIDNSLEICYEYLNKDNRVYVYDKLNGGVSSARNIAIKNIHGEWVTFCDADDWVNEDWLSIYIENANNCQLVVQSFNVIGRYSEEHYFEEYRGPIQDAVPILYNSIMPGSLWNKMIKASVLKNNQLYFNNQMFFREDEEFLLRVYPCVHDVCLVKNKTYNYVVPDFNKKYQSNDLFLHFLNIYKLLITHLYDGLAKTRDQCLNDLTSSLIWCYEKHLPKRKDFLILYKDIVGRKVMTLSKVNKLTKLTLAYLNPIIINFLLNIRFIVFRYGKVVNYYN